MKLKSRDWILLAVFFVAGAAVMLWFTHAVAKTGHDNSLFYRLLFSISILAGILAPPVDLPSDSRFVRSRRFVLMAFVFFLPQLFIAVVRFPPDPLIAVLFIFITVICLFGSFLGMALRVICEGVRDKVTKRSSVQSEHEGGGVNPAL